MRRNVQEQQTETRSIQSGVQILLTVSGIVFLLAGLVLAASGASVSSAIGSVTDRFDDSDQPADDDIDSSDGDAADAGSGNETEDTSGDSGDSGDGSTTDGGDNSDGGGDSNNDGGDGSNSDDGDGDTNGDSSDGDTDGGGTDGDDSDGGNDGNSSDSEENSSNGDDGPHTLTVTVEDQDGNTIEGADVSHDEPFSDEKTTGGNGEVKWEVENGNYSVSANADGYQSAEDSVEIDGSDKSLTLTLEEEDDSSGGGGFGGGGSNDDSNPVTFIVEDQNGNPLDNATVALEQQSLFQGKEKKSVDQDGEVDFERENGEYSFTVTVDGNESDEQTIEVDGDTRQRVTYETTDG
ncbi:carboxypeptidase regulatory-like domain-containing protein [Natrinema sp. SYSU A 869]|uniref:carboxypeptidase regulatory-like domain-containing protein n=1 Tax=Natrinema sp. SYSU A 869 TaxID=2871694 RepID=UPI001CA40400|nr:carboxypeptidase regulatory-like domain-containing protein [Natrinema sp. SYSU A 869]